MVKANNGMRRSKFLRQSDPALAELSEGETLQHPGINFSAAKKFLYEYKPSLAELSEGETLFNMALSREINTSTVL